MPRPQPIVDGAHTAAARAIRYSSLTQINRTNVSQLEVAWTYDSGETGGLQTQPIVVDGVFYGTRRSTRRRARCATGELLWKFDSGIAGSAANRGVMYWLSGDERRVFAGSRQFIYALDARTGKPIAAFGKDGRIDLRRTSAAIRATQSVRLTIPASSTRTC